MKWLRSKAKMLSTLALFALAMQFGLSFGHVHHANALIGQTEVSDRAPASTHDTDHESGDHRDVCAVCITASLANALISAPPVLPLPLATTQANARPPFDVVIAAPLRTGFQSRAPPRS